MWLNDIGIRVTNMPRSIRFYSELFGLVQVGQGGSEEKGFWYVLLQDPVSKQKLELNWYSPDPTKSMFGTPYVLGEALDHLEFRVEDVPAALQRLESLGVKPIDMRPYFDPNEYPYGTNPTGHRIAYVPDPDGIQICLYDHPEDGPNPTPGTEY